MKKLLLATALLVPAPAFAAGDVFFSLRNTDFVVLIAFLVFVGILIFAGVPKQLSGMLDKRADGIRKDLAEARALRDEAQALLASYEKKKGEVQAQADRIVANARDEAERSAEQAKADIATSVDRRMAAAEEQIANAEARAVREVRDRAITVAVAAAREVIAGRMSEDQANALIDRSIDTVGAKLH
ncbi:F0F1 ATP synthase subunit B [Wenxinia saemankumensis]|uniref:ATP synthase subunit b n=1 Tax=Wenxinia saemankumensis TaxID=1447782 RepID=A0A1M6GTY2_9RHOB|nr:F0F1 ATP synthase subunit B [Wenxinia saemankumensis]SHJ13426.1 ATP synthase F0 subcomplex B subunit [Wenxinia saemankumensis]